MGLKNGWLLLVPFLDERFVKFGNHKLVKEILHFFQ